MTNKQKLEGLQMETTEKTFLNVGAAKAAFRATMPEIVDHYRNSTLFASHNMRHCVLREWSDYDENTHTSECPGQAEDGGYDHDCWRQGCGKSWDSDWHSGAELLIKNNKGDLIKVAEWINWYRGGMGF